MTTDQSLRMMTMLLFGLGVGCAGPQQKATPKADKTPIVEALDGLCRQVRAVASDASICPHDRPEALRNNADYKAIAASEPAREIQRAASAAAPKRRYVALVALAKREGQPDWHCEELGRLIDEDPSFVQSKLDGRFLSDLDEYCRIVEKNNREVVSGGMREQVIQDEATRRSGCAAKEMLAALRGVDPVAKYSLMQQSAAEAGKANWKCAALDPSTPAVVP